MQNLTMRLGVFASLTILLFITSCGDSCEDTCENRTCESRTATQSDCVCYDGYYDENCSAAANDDMDTSYSATICGEDVNIRLEPDTDPLKFSILGLGSFPIEVGITSNTNTTADDIYTSADISIERQAYSSTESIVSTGGYFNRGDFLSIDYDIYYGQDSIVKSCTFFVSY